MPQTIDSIVDHSKLFRQRQYTELMQRKKQFENAPGCEQVTKIEDWTKSGEYRELNFKREAVSINPAKAIRRNPTRMPLACTDFTKMGPVPSNATPAAIAI